MRRAVDDHHRLALAPGAALAWDRRLAALPEVDAETNVIIGQLCAADDLDAAIEELRDGRRVAFVEHVGRPGRLGRLERAWGDVVARVPGGCHVGRDVVAAFRRHGFVITDLERFTMPTLVPVLRSWVSGLAVPRGGR